MFNEDHKIFRQGLRDFLDREVMPNIDKWEEDQRIPKEVWPKFGEMGYLGLNYPEKYGGIDADFLYSVIFMEEIAKCESGGFMITPAVMQYMSTPYINSHGSDFLKEKYLAGVIRGDLVSAIGISEPGAGSDVANIKTKAILENGEYVVNGSKTFITNGVYGDFIVAVVKTDPELGAAGVSLLIIELDSPGITRTKLKKLGWHASDTAEISFDNVKVPVENLIGEEGQGFYYLMGGLQIERLTGSIAAFASCEWAMEYSLQYMREREAFGRPINKFQVLRHRVAQLSSEIEACKQFVYYCCRLHNEGQYAVKECSMAKLLATELSNKVMTECLQFFGGYGFMEEFKMARAYRDTRVGTIGAGTSEIMGEIIAKIVIDDQDYKKAGAQSAAPKKVPTQQKHQPKKEEKMSEETVDLESVFAVIESKAASASALGCTLKFDLGDHKIYIDGKGDTNVVTAEKDDDADCTIQISAEDFAAMLSGKLNAMNAFMAGKIKVLGDMSVAMKLQSLFS